MDDERTAARRRLMGELVAEATVGLDPPASFGPEATTQPFVRWPKPDAPDLSEIQLQLNAGTVFLLGAADCSSNDDPERLRPHYADGVQVGTSGDTYVSLTFSPESVRWDPEAPPEGPAQDPLVCLLKETGLMRAFQRLASYDIVGRLSVEARKAKRRRIVHLRDDLIEARRSVSQAEAALRGRWGRHNAIQQKLRLLATAKVSLTQDTQNAQDTVDTLLDMGSQVCLREDALVLTIPAFTQGPDTAHERDCEPVRLGPFEISVGLLDCSIEIETLGDTSSGGHPHPHVSVDGTPCWGTAETQVLALIERSDAGGIAVAAVNLLRHGYSASGAYWKISRWLGDSTCSQCGEEHNQDEACENWCGDCEMRDDDDDHQYCDDCSTCYHSYREEHTGCPLCDHCYQSRRSNGNCTCCSEAEDHCTRCCSDQLSHAEDCANYPTSDLEDEESAIPESGHA